MWLSYLYVDGIGYYYGIGKGYISKKIPDKYYIDYGTFDTKNPSVCIMDSDMNLFLICNEKEIMEKSQSVFVNKLLGYYFNESDVLVKILTKKNELKKYKIVQQRFILMKSEIDTKKYKYVDLDYSKEYFIWIRLLIFILKILLVLYGIRIIFLLIG